MGVPETIRGVTVAAATAVAAMLVTATTAFASTPPLAELGQARSQLQALIAPADASGKAALTHAVSELGAATAESLWSGPTEPVPPPYGDAVFNDAGAALEALAAIRHDATVSQSALTAASSAIVDACAEIAAAARLQAGLGGEHRSGSLQLARTEFDTAFRLLGVSVTHAVAAVRRFNVEEAASVWLSNGAPELSALPQPVTGPALTLRGRPELFYFGAEGCPYCATNRWSMVLALAQFGTFSPLALSVSSPSEALIRTFSFYASQFASSYVTFVPVEGYTNQPNLPGEPLCEGRPAYPWSILQAPTPSEQELINRYDGYEPCPGVANGIPFLDVANTWTTVGSYASPLVIERMSWQQITASLSNPGSAAGQAIDGGAELLSAQICEVDHAQPARVCSSPVIRRYQEEIKSQAP